MHQYEAGEAEENVIRQIMASGGELPDDILNAPKINDGLQFYMQAFEDLTTERNHGMGIMRIPWSSIERYAHSKGLDQIETHDLHYIIRNMDNAFCNWLDKKNGESERLGRESKENPKRDR